MAAEGSSLPLSSSASTSVTIDILDDYSLSMIFNYLPLLDLLSIEKVSSRWQQLCLTAWDKRTELDFWSDFSDIFELSENCQLSVLKKFSVLKNVLERCKDSVTHLSLSWDRNKNEELPDDKLFPLIGSYLTKLSHLKTSDFPVSECRLCLFPDATIQNLKSFVFTNKHYSLIYDSDFVEFFKKAVSLEKVSISNTKITGSCLLGLENNWKEICINNSWNFRDDYLKDILRNSPNIEKLNISWTEIGIDCLKEVSDKLVSLEAVHNSGFFYEMMVREIISFRNLRKLDMEYAIRHQRVSILATLNDNMPSLEILIIANCRIIQHDFNNLANFKNLLDLNVSHTEITDEAIELVSGNCSKLKIIKCHGCPNLTEQGLIKLVEYSSELTVLNIGMHTVDFDVLTSKFVQSALNSVSKRSNSISLTVFAGYSTIEKMSKSNLLQLTTLEDKDRYPTKFKCFRVVESGRSYDFDTWYYVDYSMMKENSDFRQIGLI